MRFWNRRRRGKGGVFVDPNLFNEDPAQIKALTLLYPRLFFNVASPGAESIVDGRRYEDLFDEPKAESPNSWRELRQVWKPLDHRYNTNENRDAWTAVAYFGTILLRDGLGADHPPARTPLRLGVPRLAAGPGPRKGDSLTQVELEDRIQEGLWELSTRVEPNPKSTILKGFLGNIPLPIPLNPVSVVDAVDASRRDIGLAKDLGWIWWLQEARKHRSAQKRSGA
jgi:hypothetical protein